MWGCGGQGKLAGRKRLFRAGFRSVCDTHVQMEILRRADWRARREVEGELVIVQSRRRGSVWVEVVTRECG